MGAGKGGDGGGEAAEAAQPVVLKMVLHCAGCAKKVTKAIRRMPGVESVVADTAKNMVVVAGTADANALKARLEAKTNKAVEVVSAGSSGGPKKASAAATEETKDAGAGEKKQADKDAGAGDKDASPKEDAKEKKQLQAQQNPKEETVVLKIPLHCAGCADRIRRRIYKTKGVKDVVVEGNAKDEVQVTGTMDVPAMLSYLREKLKRPVEAVAPATKGGGEGKDKSRDAGASKDAPAEKAKDAPAAGGGERSIEDKGKGIDASAGTSTVAAAAAFMAAPPTASTYHVTPPYAYAAYQQQQGSPASASGYAYPYYGNADGMGYGYANPSPAATYYHHEPQQQPPQQYQQYPDHDQAAAAGYQPYPYRMDMSPPTQLFSDENPNACSLM